MEQKNSFWGLEKHNVIVFVLAAVSCGGSSLGFFNILEMLKTDQLNFGWFLFMFVSVILRLAPSVLLLLYFVLNKKGKKSALFIPAAFGALALEYFMSVLSSLHTAILLYNKFPGWYNTGLWSSLATCVYNLGLVALFILAVVGACLGTTKKTGKLFMIIPLCIGFAHSLIGWVSYFNSIIERIIYGFGFQWSYVTTPFIKLGFEALFIGLFIFVLKNPISPLFGNKHQSPIAESPVTEE